MSLKGQHTLLLLTEALASTAGLEDRLRLVLRAMMEAVGACGGLLGALKADSNRLVLSVHEFPLDAAGQRRFLQHHAHCFPRLFASGLGMKFFGSAPRIGVAEEMLGAEAWHSCEYYRECVAPFALDSHMLITVPSADGPWIVLLVFPHGARPSQGCATFLHDLAPHLGRALSCVARDPDAWLRADALKAITAHEQEAIVAVRLGDGSKPAQLLAATGGAEEIIQLSRLPPSHNQALAELLRLCPEALRTGSGPVTWMAPDGMRYRLEAIPSGEEQCLLVRLKTLVASPAQQLGDAEAALRWGLSKREAEVFALVARAFTNRQIGLALRISQHTARTHANNIFRKLGVSGRIEAINKVRTEVQAQPDGPEQRA